MTPHEFKIFLKLLCVIPTHQAIKGRFIPDQVVINSDFIRRNGVSLEAAKGARLSVRTYYGKQERNQ